jgi:hypothetical protein
MATPTGHTHSEKSAPYVCVSAKPVSAVSLLIGSISIMGFSAPPTSGAATQVDVHLPVFGTSPLRTQSYALVEEHLSVPAALATIRRLTGFRWEELGNQFGVSRRAMHDWAGGKQLSRKNEEAVQALLDRVREFDTGSPSATRSLLAAAATGQAAQPLFQPEPRPVAPLIRRAADKIAAAGGPLLGADQTPSEAKAPKLIKRVPITVKKT